MNNLFTGPARVWSYAGSLVGPIFKFGAVSGQVAQAEGAQKSALYNYQYSIQNAFADVENSLVASQKLIEQQAAQERLVNALKSYARLAHAAVQRRLHVVHDGAAGGAVAVPRRVAARVAARVGVLVQREHLQGDGRRLGGRGRQDDRRRRAAAGRALTGMPPLF